MSDRELRKSTQKASEETRNRSEARVLKKKSSTSPNLIDTEERELSGTADNSDTQGASNIGQEGSDEVFDIDENIPAEEHLDPLSWSTSVNTFFPEGCIVTPRILPPLPPSGSVALPPVGLESISEVSNEEQDRINQSTAMDAETFNPLLTSARREVFIVEQKIRAYTTAHVSVDLKEEIPARLKNIDDCNDICQGKIFDIILSLDENVPSDLEKTNALRKLAEDLNSKVITNSVQVREKLADLIRNKPMSMTEQAAFDRQRQKEEQEESATASKIETMLEIHLEKCLNFSKEISELKDVEDMSEQEIRSALLQWKEVWNKRLEKLNENKEKIEVDFLHDIADDEMELMVKFRDKHDQLVKDVSDKYKSLIKKDNELGLYTLAPNKSKESVCYPKVFSGKCGENVHKFVADFKAAIEAHQVRTKDQIKTLRKYLDGDAKLCIGENTLSLKNAFDALVATFGNPKTLWKKHKENMSKSITKYSWGKEKSVERRNTISRMIDFINEATTLAVEYPKLEREINCDSTLDFMYDLLPDKIQDDISKVTTKSKELSHEDVYKIVLETLVNHRELTIDKLERSSQPETKADHSKPFERKPNSHNVKLNDDHDCNDGFQC